MHALWLVGDRPASEFDRPGSIFKSTRGALQLDFTQILCYTPHMFPKTTGLKAQALTQSLCNTNPQHGDKEVAGNPSTLTHVASQGLHCLQNMGIPNKLELPPTCVQRSAHACRLARAGDALHDTGWPLSRVHQTTQPQRRLLRGWQLGRCETSQGAVNLPSSSISDVEAGSNIRRRHRAQEVTNIHIREQPGVEDQHHVRHLLSDVAQVVAAAARRKAQITRLQHSSC